MKLKDCLSIIEKELPSSFNQKILGLNTDKVKIHIRFIEELTGILEFSDEKVNKFNSQYAKMILSTHTYLQFKDSDRDQLRSFERQIRTMMSKIISVSNSPKLPDSWHSFGIGTNMDTALNSLALVEEFFTKEKKMRKKFHGKKVETVKRLRVIGEVYKFYIQFIDFKISKKMESEIQLKFNEMKIENRITKKSLIKGLVIETANSFFDIKNLDATYLSKVISEKSWNDVNPF